MGADLEELPDGLRIRGGRRLSGARCVSDGDHRIAMSLAVAGLAADGETTIEGAEWIATSFPGFEQLLQSVAQ
jgi:3-phosphoshikimate 1-carboxyvinyltransferase